MSKEVKIGLIVVAAIVCGIWGLNYLKGINLLHPSNSYYTVYNNTGGLTAGSSVQFAGAKVGRVNSIQLFTDSAAASDSTQLVLPEWLVEFTVDNPNLSITRNTKAKIEGNPLSASVINLEIIGGATAGPGDTLLGIVKNDLTETFTREIETLKQSIENLVQGVDGVVENVNTIFSDDATQGLPEVFSSLKRSIASLETTFSEVNNILEANKIKVGNSLDNLETVTAIIKTKAGDIDTIITNFSEISNEFAQADFTAILSKVEETMSEVNQITDKINNGDGSLAQVINSDSLIIEIEQTNQELQYLLNDIYTNPKKYLGFSVIGRKDRNGFSNKEEDRIREIIKEEK